jgi:hypothetical protein
MRRHFKEMNEITIRPTDNEYRDYVKKGQLMYSKRMRRKITEAEYTRWVFLLGEYYKGQVRVIHKTYKNSNLRPIRHF